MKRRLKVLWKLLKEGGVNWNNDQAQTLGAALAYYMIFSIAPMLIIVIAVADRLFGAQAERGEIFHAIRGMVGTDGAHAIGAMIRAAHHRPGAGIVASIAGVVTLILGASGVFQQLQTSLNLIWGVANAPGGGLWTFLRRRLLSFAMVLVIAFILLFSLVVSAVLAAMGKYLSARFPIGVEFWLVVNAMISFAVVTALFGSIFKILPDVRLRWRDVWLGGAVTALLFEAGKTLIGLYLGNTSLGSAYGAAGSLVVVLVWFYYSSQIFLFGAEFTKAYTHHRERRLPGEPRSSPERDIAMSVGKLIRDFPVESAVAALRSGYALGKEARSRGGRQGDLNR